MPRLTLIDGSSYLYRAFHALPPLSNAAGEPTGALFGVVNMLRETLNAKPDYAAFVIDAPGPTFRDELYPEYKANRQAMPDDLRAQVEPMLAIVEALGFPILRVAGVEADDVIGTLANHAAADGIEVEVSTGDKDFAQLVSPNVLLVNTMTHTRMGRAGVIEKFGVPPERIVDYLALMGDAVDNIPGVPKCGPKTAAKWLNEYGTLDDVIARADEVKGKIGDSLRATLPQLPLSRQLATIKTDVELDQDPRDLQLRERDTNALRTLFARYEFRQALKELGDTGIATPTAEPVSGIRTSAPRDPGSNTVGLASPSTIPDSRFSTPAAYELVTTQTQLDTWVNKLRHADLIAFDTETTALDPMRARLVGLSFSVEAGKACYIPVGHDYPGVPQQLEFDAVLAAIKPVLEDPQRPKLGQHAKYDCNVLSNYAIGVRGIAMA